jgi:hypothetical protein
MRSREYPFRSPPCRPQRAQARHKAKRTDGRRSSMYIVTCAMNADRSGDATGCGAGLSATGSGSACALRGNVTGGTQHVMADSESLPGAWRSRSAMHAQQRPARRFCLAAPPSHRRSSCTASGAPQARPAHQRHRTGSDDGRKALKPIFGHGAAVTAVRRQPQRRLQPKRSGAHTPKRSRSSPTRSRSSMRDWIVRLFESSNVLSSFACKSIPRAQEHSAHAQTRAP